MTFRVGQKVVCIATWDHNGKGYGDEVGPVKGSIYTVRCIGVGLSPKFPTSLQVRVFEILNPTRQYAEGFYEGAFAAWRFRPVDDRKTDIGVFIDILRITEAPVIAFALPSQNGKTP
jgi:hypothetical protein